MPQTGGHWVGAPFLLHRGQGLSDRRQDGLAQVYTNALVLSMLLPLEYRRAHARHPGRARNSQTDITKGSSYSGRLT